MGGFYGSIQLRTENRDQVIEVVADVTRSMQIRALVGPLINGWIGVYPQDGGQDDRVGAQIASSLDCHVIHLIVHDDDIFAYWLYRDRKLVDSFWSLPGYFGNENLAREEAMKGDPELFRPIIQNKISQLSPLLSREAPGFVFASERLDKFAKVLGIANTVTAYDYLKGGETEGIKGWRSFQELPADQVQNEAERRRESKARLKSERQALKKQGILRYSEGRKSQSPYICSTDEGFLVAWTDFVKDVEFEELRSPWKKAQPVSLPPQKHLAGIVSDRIGRRVAMTASNQIRVYDKVASEWKHVLDIPESDHAIGVVISPDGRRVIHLSRNEIVLTEVDTGRRIQSVPCHDSRLIACHPTENWLAACGNSFGFVSFDAEPHWREIYVGGKSDVYAGFDFFSSQLANLDVDQIERMYRDGFEKAVEQLNAMSKSSKTFLTDDFIEKTKRQMEASIEQSKTQLAELKKGKLPTQVKSVETVQYAGFSRSGEFLWCTTEIGLRVYAWDEINRETGSVLPPPKWSFDDPASGQVGDPMGERFYVIVEAINEPAIVFGGKSGRLYRMDLTTGQTKEVVKFPGNYWISSAVLSMDGSVLAISAMHSADVEDSFDRQRAKLVCDVWSIDKLLTSESDT